MTVIVTDAGFGPDTWTSGFVPHDEFLDDAPAHSAVDLASDADPAVLSNQLDMLEMIRIDFPNFADGRGFTIASRLRTMGYTGRLRAKGHVIADQYAMARRSGFDEVEIDSALAERQKEAQWIARAQWRSHDYQARLRA